MSACVKAKTQQRNLLLQFSPSYRRHILIHCAKPLGILLHQSSIIYGTQLGKMLTFEWLNFGQNGY